MIFLMIVFLFPTLHTMLCAYGDCTVQNWVACEFTRFSFETLSNIKSAGQNVSCISNFKAQVLM
jgi:hypothetical protein